MVRLSELPGADGLIQTNAFHNLAYAVWDAGEFERAEGLNRATARVSLETGDTINSGLALLQGATFAGTQGQAVRAATLFGVGDTHFAMHIAPLMERSYVPAAVAAKKVLGADRYEKLYNESAAMSVSEATAFLLKPVASGKPAIQLLNVGN